MPVAYAEEADVKEALQEESLSGPTGSSYVQPAIEGASEWFKRATNGHFYDGSGSGTLIGDSAESVTEVRVDVPSSPHRQDRQLVSSLSGVRYPRTQDGPFARCRLPHLYVTTLNKLEVRDRGGDVTDWVADSSYTSGRDADYYLQQRGQDSYGRTYLYVNAGSIGPRINHAELLTVDYDFGLDSQTEAWDDVRRGIASLAAAELVADDSVLAQLPESGQLVGVDTQQSKLFDRASAYLDPYISALAD